MSSSSRAITARQVAVTRSERLVEVLRSDLTDLDLTHIENPYKQCKVIRAAVKTFAESQNGPDEELIGILEELAEVLWASANEAEHQGSVKAATELGQAAEVVDTALSLARKPNRRR